MRSKSKVRCVLTEKRRKVISRALADYDIVTCFLAIDGCVLSDWHQGQNPKARRYDDVELILRDAAHIERFAMIAEEANGAASDFEAPPEVNW